MDSSNSEYDPYATNSFMGKTDSKGIYFKDRLNMIREKINYYAVRILPAIERLLAFIFFYAKKIIQGAIKIAAEQLRF